MKKHYLILMKRLMIWILLKIDTPLFNLIKIILTTFKIKIHKKTHLGRRIKKMEIKTN